MLWRKALGGLSSIRRRYLVVIDGSEYFSSKNQGYHLEHNFGHGHKNLSYTFFLLNLLAFFMHRIGELADPLYQQCRAKFSSRREYWNRLRCTIRIILVKSGESLMAPIIDPLNWNNPLDRNLGPDASRAIQSLWGRRIPAPSQPHNS